MRKNLLISSILLITMVSCFQPSNPKVSIVPKPNHIEFLPGNFRFGSTLHVKIDSAVPYPDFLFHLLTMNLGNTHQTHVIVHKPLEQKEPDISIQMVSDSTLTVGSYSIQVTKTKIHIKASNYQGVFYALHSLFQVVEKKPTGISGGIISCMEIEDKPEFTWRGMHLDVSRHFFDVAFVKKMLDAMATYKMNVFHWHLTDDQGWRIEIEKYPKLTTVSAWRDETVVGHMADVPKTYDGKKHGGFYTKAQIREVVEYAAKLGITVVPEIEMPGHAVAVLRAYPQLSCTGGPIQPFNKWGVSDDVFCAGKEETFTFLEDVMAEVIELFPGEYIHIGGDECPKTRWKVCPKCQKRMKKEKLSNEHELQSYFIQRIEKFVNAHGKKIIGWDEILEGGLAPNAAVMSWRGEAGGIAAAEMGHKVVMSPNETNYFDHYQAPRLEPLAIGGLTTMEEVYAWNPIPAGLAEDKKGFILGGQANLWTEYITEPEQVEYMAFPRLCALAEVLWTQRNLLAFYDFEQRMDMQYALLDAKKINYRIPFPIGIFEYNYLPDNIVQLKNGIPSSKIYYTLDGTEPDVHSTIYKSPILIEPDSEVVLKAITIMPSGRKSTVVNGTIVVKGQMPGSLSGEYEQGLEFALYRKSFTSVNEIEGAPDSIGIVSGLTFPNGIPSNFFGMEFTGFLKVNEPGTYIFYLDADDAASLFLYDMPVIVNDGFKYSGRRAGQIALNRGYHPIRIKFFQAKYGYDVALSYSLDGITIEPVSNEMLFIQH